MGTPCHLGWQRFPCGLIVPALQIFTDDVHAFTEGIPVADRELLQEREDAGRQF
jgi:hypothetical protein